MNLHHRETKVKKIIPVILLAISLIIAWEVGYFEKPACKAYRELHQQGIEARGFSKDLVANRKWSLDLDSCTVDGDTATVRATEKTAIIPANAASFAFATITTRQLEAKLAKVGGQWRIVEETEISKDISTYDERKNRG